MSYSVYVCSIYILCILSQDWIWTLVFIISIINIKFIITRTLYNINIILQEERQWTHQLTTAQFGLIFPQSMCATCSISFDESLKYLHFFEFFPLSCKAMVAVAIPMQKCLDLDVDILGGS